MKNLSGPLCSQIDQIGLVVVNIEQHIEYLKKFFGNDFKVLEGEAIRIFDNGEEAKIKAKAAFVQVGNIQIELLEILDGPAIHVEWLKNHGEGVHHIGMNVENFDEKLKEFKDSGVKVLHQGKGRMRYAYLDVKPFILEIIEKI